jgi:16S rRNA U1498 N3-methylase RsmE
MERGIIYLILNKQTGEKYVGNTTLAMNKEWVHHIDRSKRMSSEPLHKAFRQYGVHNFMIKEIDEYDDTSLNNKLNEWIEKYKPEYNPVEVVEIQPKPIKEKRKIQNALMMGAGFRAHSTFNSIKERKQYAVKLYFVQFIRK